jgi:hypothetical protein
MTYYIKPKTEIHDLSDEIMCTCGCNSCPGDCKCHDDNWPGHNPHGCDCSDGHGHGHHPKNIENDELL